MSWPKQDFLSPLKLIASAGVASYFAMTLLAGTQVARSAVQKDGSPDVFEMHEQAMSLFAEGSYEESLNLLHKVHEISKKQFGQRHKNTLLILSNIAAAHSELGDYSKAVDIYELVIKNNERTLGSTHPELAVELRGLADAYAKSGAYSKALPLLERSLLISKKAFGERNLQTSETLNSLGNFYGLYLGDYSQALPLLEKSHAIRANLLGADDPKTLMALGNVAHVYHEMGEIDRALVLFKRVEEGIRAKLGPEHPFLALALFNLATAVSNKGNNDHAVMLLEEALSINERTLGADHPETIATMVQLGSCYAERENFGKADENIRKALAAAENTLGPQHPDTARALQALARLAFLQGQYNQAQKYTQRILEIRQASLGSAHPDTANAYAWLAEYLYLNGDIESATSNAAVVIQSLKALSPKVSLFDEKTRLAWQRERSPLWMAVLLQPDVLQDLTLLWKGLVLESQIQDRASLRVLSGSKQGKEKLLKLKELRAALAKAAFSLGAKSEEMLEMESRVSEVERSVAATRFGANKEFGGSSIQRCDIVASLPPGSVLLDMFVFVDPKSKNEAAHSYGVLLTASEGQTHFLRINDAVEIDAAIDALRAGIDRSDKAAVEVQTKVLSERLWRPIAAHLPANTRRLFICPDAKLNFISFGTLLENDGRFVAEIYPLLYIGSGRDLVRKQSDEVSKSVVVFADPVFDVSGKASSAKEMLAMRSAEADVFGTINLPPLPGTKAEAEQLEVIAAGAGWDIETTTGEEATESRVREAKKPGILHLATHGFYLNSHSPSTEDGTRGMSVVGLNREEDKKRNENGVDPMRASGVALSGAQRTLRLWSQRKAPETQTDGILTAEEVASLDLNGTWLVTLSACETGVGEARSGEGVFGLRRAFMMAGAENLLMTLWPVADDTTASIMADFYKEALATGDAPGSLAKVQRDWLVKLREEKGLAAAIREAGPFAMVGMVNPSQSAARFSAGISAAAPTNAVSPGQPVMDLDTAKLMADSGDAYAQAVLAIRFTLGYGTVADEEKAKRYVMASAKGRNPLGIYWLSFMRGSGIGMEKNATQAKQLQNQALPALQAMSDDPYALYALSKIEQPNKAGAKRARALTKRSADLGFAPAQLDHAMNLLKSASDAEAKAEAKKYWELARGQQYSQALQTPFPP